ncbi:MAG: GGDEF domain-containing protein [Cellvibrionaceae bacterium]
MCIGYIYASVIERNEIALQKLANTDQLTKTLNRHELYQRLSHSLANCRRHDQPSSLIMIDIDYFKTINDTYGHLIGDSVLINVCRVIEDRIRETDLLFRFGCEEFALLIPRENLARAEQIAEDLRQRIEQHQFPKGVRLTISLGVSETHREDSDHTLLTRADTALYQAKERRNHVVALSIEPVTAN